jgi:DNA-binding CsgD family transcriptional regulator
MKPALGDTLEEIMAATSLDEIWALLVQHFQGHGFGAIAYLMFDKDRLDRGVAFFSEGIAPAVAHVFAERGYGRHAPALRVAMTSGQPGLASRLARSQILTPDERAHREAIMEAGLTEALILPLYGPAGRNAAVFLGQRFDDMSYDALDWSEMQMVAQAAHSRSFAVVPQRGPESHGLSDREVEILRWVAQGKSNGMIAEILGIAPGTVDTYLRRLFEKLEVSDRTAAAVKGMGLGLLQA